MRDDNAELIDLLPTIADVTGLAPRTRVDGSSLVDAARPKRRAKQMFAGDDRQRRRYPATGPDIAPALARKLALLGPAPRKPHIPLQVPGFDELVGQRLDALRVVDGGAPVELAGGGSAFAHVELGAHAAVFDVAGRFSTPQPGAVVAVAVNGVIEAVTRTWEANPRGFMGTPSFDVWRAGANAVEIFLVERDANGLLLRAARRQMVRPEGLNLITGEAVDVWGVGRTGFHPQERTTDGGVFRWTRDKALLSNLTIGASTRHVEVTVLHVPEGKPKRLTVDLNGCVLFDGEVHGGWTASLPLDACRAPAADPTLGFTAMAARTGRDNRRRGVALSRVVLR